MVKKGFNKVLLISAELDSLGHSTSQLTKTSFWMDGTAKAVAMSIERIRTLNMVMFACFDIDTNW